MFIARQLREKNIAEYLLYMWQVEDMLRANGLNMENVTKNIIDRYHPSEEQRAELTQWYANLIDMMHLEGVTEKGHLQINKNIILALTDLHIQLLHAPKVPTYGAVYYKALPYIVELRAKSGKEGRELPELETCFDALYGVMLLRIRKKPIGAETEKAVDEIGQFISLLANYYAKEKRGELDEILTN